jgi:ABC-2 type transport system ATP-binding protein
MIELQGVKKSFDGRPVLLDLSFDVEPGEIYTLLGPNGAGKTTAIHILTGLLAADAGSVRVHGEPVGEATRRQLGVAPQEISLYQDLTCRENLAFFGEIYGIRGAQRDRRVTEVTAALGLDPWAETPISELSGGWRRRVNLAAALVPSPRALVLDEPTAGLDIESRHHLWHLIEGLRASGVAVLLTTHLLDEAERLSQRIGILDAGRILVEGSISELRQRISAAQVAEIVSEDEDSVRDRARREGWRVRRYGGRLSLWLPDRVDFPLLVRRLEGVPVTSVALHEIGLEHVYAELTAGFEEPGPSPASGPATEPGATAQPPAR